MVDRTPLRPPSAANFSHPGPHPECMTRKARDAQPKGHAPQGSGKRAEPSKEPKTKKLTELQERFCQEYLVDLNATGAARRAGYKAKRLDQAAYEVLRKPEIEARIAQLQLERGRRTRITQDYVLENLEEVLERCMQRAPVMVRMGREYVQKQDDEGRDVWDFNAKGALGALKMMGDHLGMFRPALDAPDVPEGLPTSTGLEDASNDQLAGELARLLGEDAL